MRQIAAVMACALALAANGGALLTSASAYGQAVRESYCTAGSVALMIGGKDAMAKVAAECKSGDVVFMPGNSTAALGMLCDFRQTIHRSPDGSTLCVLKLPARPAR